MPDIQTAFKTALSKTLQQWDDDGEISPQPTNRLKSAKINVGIPRPTLQQL